jgi:hypothetical protein
VDLAVSTSSYAVFSAVVSACRAAVKSPPPTERSSPAADARRCYPVSNQPAPGCVEGA